MEPLFAEKPAPTLGNDLEFLSIQMEVGQQLLASPAVIEYIKYQVEILQTELFNMQSIGVNADVVKSMYIQINSQIRAYEHLYSLAQALPEMMAKFQTLTTPDNQEEGN